MRIPGKTALLQYVCMLWVVAFTWYFFSLSLPNIPASVIGAEAGQDIVVNRIAIWKSLHPTATSLPNPLDFDTSQAEGIESGLSFLGQRFGYWSVAALLFAVAWLLGAACMACLLPKAQLYRSELFVLQSGVGLSLLSLWILTAGRLALLTPVWLLVPSLILAIVLAVTAVLLRRRASAGVLSIQQSRTPASSRPVIWATIVVLFPFVFTILLGSTTPPWDFDVREYHMQGPREWLHAGQISFLEHNVYTSFPFLSEMFSLAAMVLCGDGRDGAICGKVLLCCFQLLTAIAVYAIGRRWFSQTAGLLASVIYVTTPWTLRISVIAYAEGAASFYLIAATMACLLVSLCEGQSRWRFILLTGFLAGSAMSAKYPGVLSVVIPVGLILLCTVVGKKVNDANPSEDKQKSQPGRFNRKQIVSLAIVYTFGVVVAVGPWLVRNAMDTGNPVYPLLYSVFGGKDLTPEMDAKWKAGHSPDDHDVTQIPRHLADVAMRSDWTNGLLFGLSVPVLVLLHRRFAARSLWFMAAWMLATWWGLTHRIDRFWVPIIPVLAVLAGASWQLFSTRTWKATALIALTVCTVFNLGFWKVPRLTGFHIGLMDLESARNVTVRVDFKRLNLTLPDTARVLMVGEAEVFDADFDVVYNTVFDRSIFEDWTRQESAVHEDSGTAAMKPAADILETLQREGITHVVVNWSEILRYRRPGSYGYTQYVQPSRFEELVRAGVLQKPTMLMSSDWTTLGKADRQEIQSWQGGDALVDGEVWYSVQSYRVNGELTD